MANPGTTSFRTFTTVIKVEGSIKKFKMRRDTLSRVITLVAALLCAATIYYFISNSSGSYLPAWISILFASIIFIIILSIPRSVVVTSSNIEIHCIMELTVIARDEIHSITPTNRKALRYCIPYYGAWGIFGYYGYYLNLRNFKTLKLFATQRKNLIEITYGKKFRKVIISVKERDQFLHFINSKS